MRFNLGLALLRSGDRDEALAEYSKAAHDVDDAWELRFYGIKDLEATIDVESDLAGRSEILKLLETRYEDLKRKRLEW